MSLPLFFKTPATLVNYLRRKAPAGIIGFLAGEFDLFQAAHHISLQRAKSRCDLLIVGLFPDEFIENKYGTHRPLCKLRERAEMLLGTRYVDALVNLSNGIEDFLKIVKPEKILEFRSPEELRYESRTAVTRSSPRQPVTVPVESIEIRVAEEIATETAFSRIIEKLQLSSSPVSRLKEYAPYPEEAISLPILFPEELPAFIEEKHAQKEFLITTNGSFDILHPGHLRYLQRAKTLGGVLLVLVNDDQSIRDLKGPQRPIFNQQERMQALAALQSVDYVIPFSGETPLAHLGQIKPDFHIKGGSFEEKRAAEEKKLIESYGGRWEAFDLIENYSTTTLLNRFSSLYNRRKTR